MTTKNEKIFSIVLAILSLSFYLFFAFYDGVIICADSSTYIDNSITREFLYPALLSLFRLIFGSNYLFYIILLQSIIAAYSAWKITTCMRNNFKLNYSISILVFMLPIITSALNRFVAKRGSMYSNCILTEGITISLFSIFFCHLFEFAVSKSNNSFLKCIIFSAILVATRKQMIITVILLAGVYFFVHAKTTNEKPGHKLREILHPLCHAIIISLLLLISVSLCEHTYNYFTKNTFTGHSSDSRFVLTMIFYVAEPDFVEQVPPEFQSLYTEIYETCEQNGYLMNNSPQGWYHEVSHFGDHYDHIQIDTMWPIIQNYVEQNYVTDSTTRELLTDKIVNTMIISLLPKTIGNILHVLINNLLSGFVTTIAQRTPILIWYSFFAYAGYVALLLYNIKKRGIHNKANQLCLLTLLSIIVNVSLVSAVIFCQTRYTIYNMSLFYISGLILLYSLHMNKAQA